MSQPWNITVHIHPTQTKGVTVIEDIECEGYFAIVPLVDVDRPSLRGCVNSGPFISKFNRF